MGPRPCAVLVLDLWLRWRSGRCRARPLCVPVGGVPPASRPRRELRSARRLEARPGPAAAHRHRGRSLRRPPHQWCLVAVCAGGRRPSCLCCLWPHGCSGRRRARPPARSPHASLRLGVVDLEARPCPPVPPAPSTPASLCRWRVAGCVVSKPGQAVLPVPLHTGASTLIGEPTINFAGNSLTALSNHEFRLLEFQRFQTLLKLLLIELHATFLGPGPAVTFRLRG